MSDNMETKAAEGAAGNSARSRLPAITQAQTQAAQASLSRSPSVVVARPMSASRTALQQSAGPVLARPMNAARPMSATRPRLNADAEAAAAAAAASASSPSASASASTSRPQTPRVRTLARIDSRSAIPAAQAPTMGPPPLGSVAAPAAAAAAAAVAAPAAAAAAGPTVVAAAAGPRPPSGSPPPAGRPGSAARLPTDGTTAVMAAAASASPSAAQLDSVSAPPALAAEAAAGAHAAEIPEAPVVSQPQQSRHKCAAAAAAAAARSEKDVAVLIHALTLKNQAKRDAADAKRRQRAAVHATLLPSRQAAYRQWLAAPADESALAVLLPVVTLLQDAVRRYQDDSYQLFARRQKYVVQLWSALDARSKGQRRAQQSKRVVRAATLIQRMVAGAQARACANFKRQRATFYAQLERKQKASLLAALPQPPAWMSESDLKAAAEQMDAAAHADESAGDGGGDGAEAEQEGVYRSFLHSANPFMPPQQMSGGASSSGLVVHNPPLDEHELSNALKRASTLLTQSKLIEASKLIRGQLSQAEPGGARFPGQARLDDWTYLHVLCAASTANTWRSALEELRGLPHPGTASPVVALFVLAVLQFRAAGSSLRALEVAQLYAKDFDRAAVRITTTPDAWRVTLTRLMDDVLVQRRKLLGPPGPSPAQLLAEEWAQRKQTDSDLQSKPIDSVFKMIGLHAVKKQMLTLRDKVALLKKRGEALAKEKFHTCFVGTGKTTVARLYGDLLKELGVLAPGGLVKELTGAKLAADGAQGFDDLLKEFDKAGGGLLFIDEAYQLEPDRSSGGRDVCNQLLVELENRANLTVVLAGYADRIDALLQFNPGFPSRFPYRFTFEDYTYEELLSIATATLKSENRSREAGGQRVFEYEDGEGGRYVQVLMRRLSRCSGRAGFGNARAVRVAINAMRDRQAFRLNSGGGGRGRRAHDEYVFTLEDMIGPRPTLALLEACPAWDELQRMTGLADLKTQIMALVAALEENYDLELQNKANLRTVSLNKTFIGNPGTGKTTVAKMYGRILAHLGMLSKGELVETTASDFVGAVLGGSEAQTRAILDRSAGCVLLIDEAYALNPHGSGGGGGGGGGGSGGDPYRSAVIDTLVANVHNKPGDDRCVLMLGYKSEMDELFRVTNPGFKRRFGASAFEFPDFTSDELAAILRDAILSRSLQPDTDAILAAVDQLEKQKMAPNFGNAGAVEALLSNAIARRTVRVNAIADPDRRRREALSNLLIAADFVPDDPTRGQSVAQIFAAIVGSQKVKKEIEKLQHAIDLATKKGKADPFADIPRNYLFLGPPGTGKTTVAQLCGQLFHRIGLLSSADVVEVSASKFVTGFVGQAAIQTLKVLRSGLGKVLFIDEAYRLNPGRGGGASFNGEVLDELTNALTSPEFKGRMVVILAGYESEVEALLGANPGLSSRFPVRWMFEAFGYEDSWLVFESKLKAKGLQLRAPGAAMLKQRLKPEMSQLMDSADWGNGRDLDALADAVKRIVIAQHAASGDGETPDDAAAAAASSSSSSSSGGQSGAAAEPREVTGEDGVEYLLVGEKEVRRAVADTLRSKKRSGQQRAAAEQRDGAGGRPGYASQSASDREQDLAKAVAMDAADASDSDGSDSDGEGEGEGGGGVQMEAGVRASKFEQLQEQKANYDRLRQRMNDKDKKREEQRQKVLANIGQCQAGYEWIPDGDGYRCAGGSHFMTIADIDKHIK